MDHHGSVFNAKLMRGLGVCASELLDKVWHWDAISCRALRGRDSCLDGIVEYYTIFLDTSHLSQLGLEAAPRGMHWSFLWNQAFHMVLGKWLCWHVKPQASWSVATKLFKLQVTIKFCIFCYIKSPLVSLPNCSFVGHDYQNGLLKLSQIFY